MQQLELASIVFPFEKDILIGPSDFKINSQILDTETYMLFKQTLKYDPNSARLLGMYMQYANHFGNKNEAIMAFKKLEKIAPNSNVLKQINRNDYR